MAAVKVSDKQLQIILLLLNGFREKEIADTLDLSVRSVDTIKSRIFRSLNVRNTVELGRAAYINGIIKGTELCFSPREIIVSPRPAKILGIRRNYDNQDEKRRVRCGQCNDIA